MYRSQPCLPFFSSVVKNIANPNIEVKKLVNIYVLHYAESEPDLALLSINTIQKSLSDQNPQVRAMALRVMSGIRVPVISQIVSLAIKKGCGDMSPHVRKAAALAIPKCYRLEPSTIPQLLECLSTLLGDRQYYVVGSAVTAFLEICPDRIDLIHKHYRSLIRKLVDMDDWGQLALIRLMTYYARKCFPRRKERAKKHGGKGFYEDEPVKDDAAGEEVHVLDPDLELLLKACKPLLASRNSAVIVAVVTCFLHLGTVEYIDAAVGPLIALLRGPQDMQPVVLYNVVSVCLIQPASFVPYTSHFFIRSNDAPEIWRLKIEMLTLVFSFCDQDTKCLVLNELEHFTKSNDGDLVRESVRAIGRCAQNDLKTSSRCMNLLLKQASSPDDHLVAEALTVVRHLIQQDPSSHTTTVVRLAKNLDKMTNPDARATVIWLIGEFSGIGGENNIAPDVLRILAQGFADESESAKLQIVLLAAKVYVHHLNRVNRCEETAGPRDSEEGAPLKGSGRYVPRDEDNVLEPSAEVDHPIAILWNYIQLLARYDVSYDLRDRARYYKALLADTSSTQLASLLLLAPKPVPYTPSPTEGRRDLLLGSTSLVLGKDAGINGLPGYEPLPDWVKAGEEPNPRLREEVGTKSSQGGSGSVPASEKLDSALRAEGIETPPGSSVAIKDKSLDDWLAEDAEPNKAGNDRSETESESGEEYEFNEETEEEGSEETEGDDSDEQAEPSERLVKQA